MSTKTMKTPSAAHPISIERTAARVVVKVAGRTIADTHAALTLREASYPPVLYIPRADADMTQLQRTEHSTYCPYKGDASYYSIAQAPNGANAIWTYESPYDAVAAIKDHLAFYPDRVDSIAEVAD